MGYLAQSYESALMENEQLRAQLADSQAQVAALREALVLSVEAMRAPLDDWKGVVEEKALGVARELLKEGSPQ